MESCFTRWAGWQQHCPPFGQSSALLWLNFCEKQSLLSDSQKTIELLTCDGRHKTQTKPVIPQLVARVTKDERKFIFGGKGAGDAED